MQAMEIQEHARKMLATYGERAQLEVAQKASTLEKNGDDESAKDWRRIEMAIRKTPPRPPCASA